LKKCILLLFCCLLIPWSAEAKDQTINLKYIPREKVKVKPRNVSAERIYFEEVDDARSRPQEIGENKENKGKPITILTSQEDGAGQFTLSVLKNEFQEKGFKVESRPGEASKIVSTTLLKFWTLEDSNYNTEIKLRVEVREKKGEPFFKKTYSSAGTNRGRSLSEGNYNECISDALARLTDDLFSDSEFLRVLAERPKPPRVEEKRVEEKRAEEKKLEDLKAEEKRLEELKAEVRRLEEIKAAERRAKEKQDEEKRAEEKRLREIKAEEKRLEERKAEEKRAKEKQDEEKRLEEIRMEVQRLEEKKAEEKRAEEKRAEELKAEEKRLEEIKAEVKRLEELKALKEGIKAEGKPAKKAPAPAPAKPKPVVEPVFGPK
jgi:flagellar biosynthesis GTPase FlhF